MTTLNPHGSDPTRTGRQDPISVLEVMNRFDDAFDHLALAAPEVLRDGGFGHAEVLGQRPQCRVPGCSK